MHEIVTVQLGQFSNYVATHFWNAQESYFTYDASDESPVDHDIHWRPGVAADGSDTFLPRTVIYDLKGGFGSLRKTNALYDTTQPDQSQGQRSAWSGTPIVQQQDLIAPSDYQRSLDSGTTPQRLTASDVRFWSDYSRTFFHPKSIVQLYDYELNSSLMPFQSWSQGRDLFELLDKDHDLIDRDFRPFAEECDNMQGIQVFTAMDDAWGGFASVYLEHLRDEYGKSCIWTWGAREALAGTDRAQRLSRVGNFARSLAEISEQTSMLVPLALPRELPSYIGVSPASPWQTSALLEAGLESATLPTRLRSISQTPANMLGGLAELLNSTGSRTVAKLSADVERAQPLDTTRGDLRESQNSEDDYRIPTTLQFEDGISLSSIPLVANGPGRTSLTTQGRDAPFFGQILVERSRSTKQGDVSDPSQAGQTRRQIPDTPLTKQFSFELGLPVPDSFPRIFLEQHGVPEPDTVALRALLSTDTSLSTDVRRLRSTIVPYMPPTEREMMSNRLAEIADAYWEGWSSGSDEDDD